MAAKLLQRIRGINREQEGDYEADDYELIKSPDGRMINPKTGKTFDEEEGGAKK